ncbi:transmembrane protein, putative (macronuclear) [Tetrahymena thermophila SB210]|uniref:Transmembrane protein, putative n=1 Tax=Tetrahymena thermophila (strain SB210) TaxID=312017 RepID=I7M872_TETTS|nr:transmembrane protein, putative [Tetrahymena thermophila SB210]EAR97294.2 transmembrane protein, putative [Tetrahymena thermophila SB210]|eukprot:XP_001017539.2 transmembrane protein, putative [Tetrahymena thermophila SB210]
MSILAQISAKQKRTKTQDNIQMYSSKSIHTVKNETEEDNLCEDNKGDNLSPTYFRGPMFSQQKMNGQQLFLETIDEKSDYDQIKNSAYNFRLMKMHNSQEKEYPVLAFDNTSLTNGSEQTRKRLTQDGNKNETNDEIMKSSRKTDNKNEEQEEANKQGLTHHFKVKCELQPLRQNIFREESSESNILSVNHRETYLQQEQQLELDVSPEFQVFSDQLRKIDGMKCYKKVIHQDFIKLEGYQFKDYVLKEFLRAQRFSLKTISIKECKVTNKSRIEALYMIFLQDDLYVGDFPKLQEISLDLLETEKDLQNQSSSSKKKKQHDSKINMLLNLQNVLQNADTKKINRSRVMYKKTLDDIQKEFEVVKKMEYCIQCDGQVMIINQLAFQDKKAFFYIKRHLAQKAESLRCLVFTNIANLRKNSLKSIFENLREVTTLQEINFINTIINQDSLILIRNIILWFSDELRSIKFIENQLNENDLQLLFLDKNHLHISDLVNLEELIIQKNPQATNSSSYNEIMKIFRKQIEIAWEKRENAVCLPLFSSVTYLSSRPYFKLFPFNLYPRNYSLIFNDDYLFESYNDELDDLMLDMLFRIQYTDFCQKLDLSQVSFLGADPEIINLLAEVICNSKSVQVVYLKNNQQVLDMLESKLLQKNEIGKKNKLNDKLIQLNKTFLEFKLFGSQSSIFKNKNLKSIVSIAFFVHEFTIDFQGTTLQQDALLGLIAGLVNCRNQLEEIGKKQNINRYLDFSNPLLVSPYLKSFQLKNISNLEDIQPIDFKKFLIEFFVLFGNTLEEFMLENVEFEHFYLEEMERALKIATQELERIGTPLFHLKKFGLSRIGKYSIEFEEFYQTLYKIFPLLDTIRFQQNYFIPRIKTLNQNYESTNTKILNLDLSGLKLKSGYCQWQKIFRIFFSQPSITNLNLSESSFDISSAEEFMFEFIKAKDKCKLIGLKYLDFSKTNLSNTNLIYDQQNLQNNQNLHISTIQGHFQFGISSNNNGLVSLQHSKIHLKEIHPLKQTTARSSTILKYAVEDSQEINVSNKVYHKKNQTLIYHLFDSVFNFTKIRHLDISQTQLTSQGLSIIINRMKSSANIQTSLRYINISGNPLAIGKLNKFFQCVFDYLKDVEEVHMQDLGDISQHLDSLYLFITKKQKRLEQLKVLNLSGSYFIPNNEEQTNDLSIIIYELIINCQCLELSQVITSNSVAQKISEKLFYEVTNHSKNIYCLKSINLSHNPSLSEKSWKMLIKSLMLNFSHSLEKIDVSYNQLNKQKISYILEALEEAQVEVKNQSIPMMKLSKFIMKGNHMLSEDKQAGQIWQNIIFRLLSQKQINLIEINLNDNKINDQIAECLLKGLKQANQKTLQDPIEKSIYGLNDITFLNNLVSRKMLVQLKNNFLLYFCNNISIQNIEYKKNLDQNMQIFRNNRKEITQKVKLRGGFDLDCNTSQKILQKFVLGDQCASSQIGCVDILKNILLSFNKIKHLEVYIKYPEKVQTIWLELNQKNLGANNCQIHDLTIKLSKNTDISDIQWNNILKGFFTFSSTITGVYLENVGLTGSSLNAVVTQIVSHVKNLENFSIADNPMLKGDKVNTGQSLKLLLKLKATQLKYLSLRNCSLCEQVIEQICSGIKENKTTSLEKLDLSMNQRIQPGAWFSLILVFLENSQIQHLNLSECLLNNASIKCISQAFNKLSQSQTQPNLAELNLSKNSSLHYDGWSVFFSALFNTFGKVLEDLDLSFCAMDGNKTLALADVLKEQRLQNKQINLTRLNYKGNHFKQQNAWEQFIFEVLSVNGLHDLDLSDCDFEDKQITQITNKLSTMLVKSTIQKLKISNSSSATLYYYDVKKERYKISLLKSILSLGNSVFAQLKVIHLENCIKTRISSKNLLQTFIDLSNLNIKSNFLEEIYLSGNKISGLVWSKLIPLIFEFQPRIRAIGIDREIKLSKEDYNEFEYIDGIAKGFADVQESILYLENIIFSDHRRNRQESWYNLLSIILNEKKVFRTIKHILVRSNENFVHESAFFLAFSELINEDNFQMESNMTRTFTLFEKEKGTNFASASQAINNQPKKQQQKKQFNYLQTIAYSDKSSQTFIIPSYFLIHLLKGVVSCIENGQIMVEKQEESYIKNFWASDKSEEVKIMVRPWHSVMKFQGGIPENDYQKKTELYSSLNDIRKLLSIGKEELILDFDFDYRNFPLFSITNPLAFNPYKMNEVNLEEIFGNISNLYFDYPLYCFLVECCSIYPGENINEFFVKFTQTFANKADNFFQKIQTTPTLSLTNEDKDLIQDALSQNLPTFQTANSINNTPKLKPIEDECKQSDSPQLKQTSPLKKSAQLPNIIGQIDSSIKLPIQMQNQNPSRKSPTLSRKSNFGLDMSYGQKAIFNKLFKKRAPLSVLCPYFFDSQNLQNYDEELLLERLRCMPASTLKVRNLSISALKSIYSTCYQNPYFMACEMDYQFLTFINVSLAYSARERIFESHKPPSRSSIGSMVNKIIWKIINALVSLDTYFEFDENTIVLNEYLEEHNYLKVILVIFFILYMLICYFGPYPLTAYDDLLDKIGRGVSWKSHIIYSIFAIITMIYEIYLVSIVIKQTNHLVPGIRLGGQPDCPTKFVDTLKTKLMNIQIFGYKNLLYILQLLFSQQNRLNTYTNFCFLVVLEQHSRFDLLTVWAIILVVTQISLFYKIYLFKTQKQSLSSQHNNINHYYWVASFGNFNAIADLLDVISPCNTTVIPSNWYTKLIFPTLQGKAVNNRMIRVIQEAIFEHIPQLFVQIVFFSQAIKSLDLTAILSFTSSVFSLILTIFKFLTIGQTIITQLDFDNLSIIKQSEMKKVMEDFRDNESKMMEQIKGVCIKSDSKSNSVQNDQDSSPGLVSEKLNRPPTKSIGQKLRNTLFKKTPQLAPASSKHSLNGKETFQSEENSKL